MNLTVFLDQYEIEQMQIFCKSDFEEYVDLYETNIEQNNRPAHVMLDKKAITSRNQSFQRTYCYCSVLATNLYYHIILTVTT